MNTHQKVFLSGAVAFGLVAAAFASSPAPSKAAPTEVQMEQVMIIGHRSAAPVDVTFEQVTVVGHRSDLMAQSDRAPASKTAG
jgi:hypothetical protein